MLMYFSIVGRKMMIYQQQFELSSMFRKFSFHGFLLSCFKRHLQRFCQWQDFCFTIFAWRARGLKCTPVFTLHAAIAKHFVSAASRCDNAGCRSCRSTQFRHGVGGSLAAFTFTLIFCVRVVGMFWEVLRLTAWVKLNVCGKQRSTSLHMFDLYWCGCHIYIYIYLQICI